MKNTSILILAVLLTSCGYLFMREIECREFKTDYVSYFPGMPGDTITFVSSDSLLKHFVVREKLIRHTTKYITDTGCSCLDAMQILYISGNDSIWSFYRDNYIYEEMDQEYFEIFFVIDGVNSGFNVAELDSSYVGQPFNGIDVTGQKRFISKSERPRNTMAECLIAENVGVLQFRRDDGKTWTRTDVRNQRTDMASFVISEGVCN